MDAMLNSSAHITLLSRIQAAKVSIALLVLVTLVIIKAGLYSSGGLFGTDFPWHIEYAKYFMTLHTIPTTDWLTWTHEGKPYSGTQWLGQILIGVPYLIGGYQMSAIVASLAIGGVVFFSWRTALLYIRHPLTALFVALFTTGQMWMLAARPQLFGMVAFSALVWMLAVWFERKERWVLFAMPALMALWVNLHGSYSIGILYIAAVGGGTYIVTITANGGRVIDGIRQHFPLAIASFTSIIATLLNPFGWHAWEYVYDMTKLVTALNGTVGEWLPTSLGTPTGQSFITLVLIVFGTMAASKKRPSLQLLVGFITTVLFGMNAERQTFFAAIALTPFLARSVCSSKLEELLDKQLMSQVSAMTTALILGAACMLYWPIYTSSKQVAETHVQAIFPFKAIQFLDDNKIEGRLFNESIAGGFIESKGRKAFIDGRLDMFGHEMSLGWLNARNGMPGWDKYLAKYNPQIFLLANDAPLKQLLLIQNGYAMIYEDADSSVIIKNEPQYSSVLTKYGLPRFQRHL